MLITKPSRDYELIDSGGLQKLERFGKFVLSRPDPQAIWLPKMSATEWADRADAQFVREGKKTEWKTKGDFPKEWQIEFGGLNFYIRPNLFKHTGIFPEQLSNWQWMSDLITKRVATGATPNVLNLFGYTGGASLACLKVGATVTHLDGSKSVIAWVRENAELSGLKGKPLRSICEDAIAFVKREIKRGNRYDGILLDPPAFGNGPSGEKWEIENDLPKLMELLKEVLTEKPLFFLINGYASGFSSVGYMNLIAPTLRKFGGQFENGELGIEESSENARVLPCGIFARWSE